MTWVRANPGLSQLHLADSPVFSVDSDLGQVFSSFPQHWLGTAAGSQL